MAERWELMNDMLRPVDNALGMGIDVLRRAGVYDPMKNSVYSFMRGMLRSQFERDNALEIVGLENVPTTGGAIFASNHQSWLDVQVIVAANERRVQFVAKDMFETWPFLRHLIDMSDSLFIRRGGDTEGLQQVADALKSGSLVTIFPEGTIPGEEDVPRWAVEPDTGLLPGKTGVVRLALMAGVPIIPVGLSGTSQVLPPEVYPRLEQIAAERNAPLTIRFGKPITFPGVSLEACGRDELRAMTKQVMQAISDLVDHQRSYAPVTLPITRKEKPSRDPIYAHRSEPTKGKKKAPLGVLVLHGFTSHVGCVSPIEPLLQERNLPYRFPILRGHGGRPEDLAGVRATDWYEDAEDALLELVTECEKAIVIGHSMGGLMALELASRRPEYVAGVIAASPALKFADPAAPLTPILAKLIGFWPSPNAYLDDDLRKKNNQNYPRFAIDAFASLYKHAGEVTNILSFIKAPIRILQPRQDQVVAPKVATLVYDKVASKDKKVVWIEDGGHEMYLDRGAAECLAATATALDELTAR